MKISGLILCVCVYSAVLISGISASQNTSYNCSLIPTEVVDGGCDFLRTWLKGKPESADCVKKIMESKYTYDSERHYAFTNLTAQYCSDVSNYTNCSDCFLSAFKYFWNKDICLFFDKYHIPEVKQCLQTYQNDKFNWSRKVIFDEQLRSVNISRDKYNECSTVFPTQDIPNNKTVNFPVYLRLQPEFVDDLFNVFLSLILEAFEVRPTNASTGVTCQHIVGSKLLPNYKRLSEAEMNKTPKEVQHIYANLRSNMCPNKTSCEKCYKDADELFLFHIFNTDLKVSSMRKDFLKINSTLSDCNKNNISLNYSSLETFVQHSQSSWYANFSNCWNNKSKDYKDTIKNNTQTIIGIGQNEAVVKSVAANYFAFNIRQSLIGNVTKRCHDVRHSHIWCIAAGLMEAVTIFSNITQNITEDKQLEMLSINIGECGKPPIKVGVKKRKA